MVALHRANSRTTSASNFTHPAVVQVLQHPLPLAAVQPAVDEGLDLLPVAKQSEASSIRYFPTYNQRRKIAY